MPKYSQHFLRNNFAVKKIADICNENFAEHIVEIGPGKGALTKALLPNWAGKFTAVEIDTNLAQYLKSTLPENSVNIINDNFLNLDLVSFLGDNKKIQFVGNLPYDCASAILQKILGFENFCSAVLMFQKEVAQRIVAKAGSSKYGVLSLSAQSRAEVKLIFSLGRGSFSPPPNVDSSVVEFTKLKKPVFLSKKEEKNFFKIIKAAFMHRRKTLLNSLCLSLDLNKNDALDLLSKADMNPKLRAQDIALQGYIKLAKLFT